MSRFGAMVLAGASAAVIAASAQAFVIVDDDADWNAVGVAGPVYTSGLTDPDANVWGSGVAGVQFFGPANASGLPKEDHVYETGNIANFGGGDWATGGAQSISLSFYDGGNTYSPDALSIYLQAGGFTWYYNVAGTALSLPDTSDGWNNYTASLASGLWYSTDGGTALATDLAAVTQAGIRLIYTQGNVNPQDYGIADYAITYYNIGMVPEPGTYMIVSTALMSLGYSFARRRREKAA